MIYLNFTPSQPSPCTALLDSECTAHFLLENAKCSNKKSTTTPLAVRLPNGDIITATHTATLNMPSLPQAARQAHVLPGLPQHSLLSVGKMCDSGCSVTFTASNVTVTNGESTILTGLREKESSLWRVPLDPNPPLNVGQEHSAHNVYEQKSIQDTITYLHAYCFSPVTDMWIKSIQNGNFATWPSVTVANVGKYLFKYDATAKGHMNQIRQNIRSTQPVVEITAPEIDMIQEDKCHCIYTTTIETNQIYSDLTGRFPTTSLSGKKYILILYDYDSNSVLSAPMKNRGDKEMVRSFDFLIQSLIVRGFKPHLQRLDNEASLALINYLTQQIITYQLAPPHIQRKNNVERAIQTFKNHFIAGLCSVDPTFPLKLWDKLLPQATITLNLLRKSRINLRMSAYAQFNGHFDFNRTPLAPPGTRIIAHEKPYQRASWDHHGLDGYYVGTALDHYRCYQAHITKTKGNRIVHTVEFSPAKLAMPSTSSIDLASIAALELSNALQNPAPVAPLSQIGTTQLQALRQLSDIFSAALPSGTSQHAPPLSQNSSQFRSTVQQGTSNPTRMPRQPIPTPFCSPSLAPRRSQRIIPIQLPSPRVTPRVNSSHVAPPRVPTPLPPTTVIHITPHPASVNAPYIPQGMAGVNLFDTFEEEHMTTPTIPQYNTRALARQHAAHQAQTLSPRIFRPIAFTSPQHIPMPMANSVINEDTGASLEYRHLIKDDSTFTVWNKAAANEFVRLAQGVGGRIEGSNTIFFIPRQAVPKGKIITYGRFVVDIRPNKSEIHRVRLTVGGNLIQYLGDASTRAAYLTTSKCLWNSTISTDGARYMCLDDVKNLYLGTPMDTFEYMRIPTKLIPHEIIEQYNLLPLVSDGHVYIEVQKGMYGLPQAAILANQLLAR
jgi:hypothetical protein